VAEFISDHYGREAVDYLAEPLLSGVYGGDPERLSVASVLPRFVELENRFGSLTRGVLEELRRSRQRQPSGNSTLFRTLKGGLGDLVGALETRLGPALERIAGEAEALERLPDGGYRLRVNGAWIEARNVVLACQAYEAGAIVNPLDGRLGELLSGVGYSSAMTVAMVYRRAELGRMPKGFGFLVPKAERRRLVACTFVETKFSHRAPDSLAILRCFLGGAGDAAALEESDESILAAVAGELRHLVGITATPAFHRIARWPRSMAQYTVGHAARIQEVEALRARLAGLHLAGNAYYGIGIPDCIRMGRQAAEAVTAASLRP
jgi:oxygen-dependent protoporphyrinogen oxidase